MNLSQDQLKRIFNYDPVTGWFTNIDSRGRAAAGARAGASTGHGYRRIMIDYGKFYEHHLAWLYVYGEWPEELDHINGNRADNRIENLRLCNRSQNNFNSERATGKSGLRGAYLDSRNQQWFSKIQIGGQVIFLGNFDSVEEAHRAFMHAVDKYHGEFAFRNRPETITRRI